MAKSKALNILIPEELYDKIKKEADQLNISMASVVRISLSEHVKKEQK